MNRIVGINIDFASTGSSQTWTAPAGVTSILITFGDRTVGTTMRIPSFPITVVPNATYVFTINQTGYTSYGSPNTFGSLFSWLGANRIYIQWIE
jgi:hypothetical protein